MQTPDADKCRMAACLTKVYNRPADRANSGEMRIQRLNNEFPPACETAGVATGNVRRLGIDYEFT